MGDTTESKGKTGVFMPKSASFEATELFKRINARLPAVNIIQLRAQSPSTTILRWIAHAMKAAFNQGVTLSDGKLAESDLNKTVLTSFDKMTEAMSFGAGSGNTSRDLPISIKSFFMLFASTTMARYNFKIMSSPDISVKTDAGWSKADKSIIKMITGAIGGAINTVSGGEGGPTFASLVGTSLDYLGYDIQLGPHFKVSDVMKNYPTFSFTTKLVNDSSTSAAINKQIIHDLTRKSLPTAGSHTTDAERKDVGLGTKFEQNFSFQPGSLFNVMVGVSIGAGDDKNKVTPLKQLFLCTANITVKAIGIYRDGKTPELYELKFDFTSLLPDYYNLQIQNFQKRAEGTALLGLPPARGFDTNDGQRYGPINPDYKPGIKWQSNEFTKLPGHYSVDGHWHPVNVMENPTGIMLDENGYPMTYWQQQAYVKDVMAGLQKKLNNQAPMSDEDLALWGDIYPTLDKP